MGLDRSLIGWFRRYGFIALTIVCLLFVQSQRALAQVDEGAITGTIQDPSGAAVPNAQVTLLNTDQGITLETHTNGAGVYTFSPVRIGHYTVTATAPGFSTTTQQNLTVAVGQELQVNVALKTGASSTTVTVSTAPPQLQTEESSVGQVVNEQSVNSLPLNGRNFTFLAQLGAGVNTSQADTRGNAGSGAFTANGLRPAQNNYLLDGIDNNSNAVDFLNGTNFVVLPPVDAIEEFKVQTADFSAELGRSAGAVLNATIKSGTNQIHGAAWEFFRNDKLDAADYFETAGKGDLQQNQFGASIGGPVIKNKVFFFGDYEGLRRVQGASFSDVGVPTTAESSSGFTDLSDLLESTEHTDALGRSFPLGTVMDPQTTRSVAPGAVDPTSGYANNSGSAVSVRDPIGTSCPPTTKNYAGCNLNQIAAGRQVTNAAKILALYPSTASGEFNADPKIYEHRNQFDIRGDYNIASSDQVFVRFSYSDDPVFYPGPFGGVADGGGFQNGLQTAKTDQAVAAYTHVFNPNLINVGRVGFNHLHTTRFGPDGSVQGIPAQYGIAGIPQNSENGGLPEINIGGLADLGSNDFLPSDEVSQTLQVTDDFTKIYGRHSFKMGVEFQNVDFNTLQPAYSRGEFDFGTNSSGNYAGVPGDTTDENQTARADFLIAPGSNGIGGAGSVEASNISKTYDHRTYLALYFQDDFKVNPKLTLNLGLRWDYFSPIGETNGGQANFVQTGPPNGTPTYLIPSTGKDNRELSCSNPANCPGGTTNSTLNGAGFYDLAAKDGINIDYTSKYGNGLTQSQKNNFAPRVGFAYQVNDKLVVRGGLGLFYNAFENQGYGPNIGENYPFVFNFHFSGSNDSQPFGSSTSNPYGKPGCSSPAATIEVGLSCTSFTPTAVIASGLGLQGLQFNYQTPRTLSTNLTVQYALTHTISAQVAYVLTDGSNLQQGIGDNEPFQLVPANTSLTATATQPVNYIPFPDFGEGGSYQRTIGNSIYNGLQTKIEQQLSNGLNYLVTYTYSKTLSDAGDLLNGGSTNGLRAPWVPGFGKGKKYGGNAGKLEDSLIGGWSLQTIASLQGGQPLSLGCPTSTTSGTGCNDVTTGQPEKLGIHNIFVGGTKYISWLGNPAAFQQPCELGPNGPIPGSPAGCIPFTGAQILGGGPSTTYGPGLDRFDLSGFKAFQITERVSAQFRAEAFNILNHPTFNAPGFGGNGVNSIGGSTNFNDPHFGTIGSTRLSPYDPRQIQFALKFYY